MIRFAPQIVGALAAMIVLGCSKPAPREITGQVFIVTRGKASVKMALVEVRLYEARVLEAHIKANGPRVIELTERAESVSREATNLATNAEAKKESALEASKAAVGDSWFDVRLSQFKIAKLEAQQAREISNSAKALVQVFRSAVPYFTELPKQPIATTKTDAEGSFTLHAPSGATQLALAATTSRAVLSGEEAYFWAVRIPDDGAANIWLTNDNECAAGSSASLLHTLTLDAEASNSLLLSLDELQSRLSKLSVRQSGPPASQPSIATKNNSSAPPLPDLPALPPPPAPEFVRLTVATTLRDAKGREIKTLERGKRLRVATRTETEITVYFWNEQYSIPIARTEPSQ